jgi:uncharacterized protein YtpQ (UPF0354 family)
VTGLQWRILGLCLASCVQAARAGDIPQDETGFTGYVAEQLKKEVGEEMVTIQGPLTLSLGELHANLDRIYGFCRKNPDGCTRQITNYVKAAAQVYRDKNAPPSRDAVRLVVRSSKYLQQAPPADAVQLQPRPFVEGLVILPVLDGPSSIRMLAEKDNKALGLSADEVYELGLKNLRAGLKPLMQVAKTAGQGQIGQLVGDVYQPSRLVLHDDWAPLAAAQNGTLIVAAPATDAVFYIGEDTPTAIDALRTLARNVITRSPNGLAAILLRWTAVGWEVVN